MAEGEGFRPGVVTTDVLRDIAAQAEQAACRGDTLAMSFMLGRIAEWALTAAGAAEAAAASEEAA